MKDGKAFVFKFDMMKHSNNHSRRNRSTCRMVSCYVPHEIVCLVATRFPKSCSMFGLWTIWLFFNFICDMKKNMVGGINARIMEIIMRKVF